MSEPADFTRAIFERLWPDYLERYQREMDELREWLEGLTDYEWWELVDACGKTKEG